MQYTLASRSSLPQTIEIHTHGHTDTRTHRYKFIFGKLGASRFCVSVCVHCVLWIQHIYIFSQFTWHSKVCLCFKDILKSENHNNINSETHVNYTMNVLNCQLKVAPFTIYTIFATVQLAYLPILTIYPSVCGICRYSVCPYSFLSLDNFFDRLFLLNLNNQLAM